MGQARSRSGGWLAAGEREERLLVSITQTSSLLPLKPE